MPSTLTRLVFDIPHKLALVSNRQPGNRHQLAAQRRALHTIASTVAVQPFPTPAHALWTVQYAKGTTWKADPDNLQPTAKACFDQLTRAGLVEDDAPRYVPTVTYSRGENLAVTGMYRLTLTLTACTGPGCTRCPEGDTK